MFPRIRTSYDYPTDDAGVINGFPYAKRAEFRHGDRRGCLKGTRGVVLDEIGLWTKDFTKPPVYCLMGWPERGRRLSHRRLRTGLSRTDSSVPPSSAHEILRIGVISTSSSPPLPSSSHENMPNFDRTLSLLSGRIQGSPTNPCVTRCTN